MSESPLAKRAWFVQERLLSRRVIHFGSRQILWECHETDACETFPNGIPMIVTQYPWNEWNFRFKDLISLGSHEFQDRAFDAWGRIVIAYSGGALSRISDKTLALAGIADEMAQRLSDTYIASMWKRHLEYHLLWSGSSTVVAKRSPYHLAPSWSWLSMTGSVTPWDWDTKNSSLLANIVDEQARDNVGSSCAWSTGGRLQLTGILWKAAVKSPLFVDEHIQNRSVESLYPKGQELVEDGSLVTDWDDVEFQLPAELFCLPIIRGLRPSALTERISGLTLISTGATNEFRRVGRFAFGRHGKHSPRRDDSFLRSFYEDIPRRIITLI